MEMAVQSRATHKGYEDLLCIKNRNVCIGCIGYNSFRTNIRKTTALHQLQGIKSTFLLLPPVVLLLRDAKNSILKRANVAVPSYNNYTCEGCVAQHASWDFSRIWKGRAHRNILKMHDPFKISIGR